MAWRVVAIENQASLSIKDNKIVIKQNWIPNQARNDDGTMKIKSANDEGAHKEASLPLEDIDSLVLDSYGISLSANLLTELAARGIATTICDAKHLPCGCIVPYSQHSRGAKISRAQLNISEPFRKQLWARIVQQKITNQAAVLEKFGFNPENLLKLAREVRSGDVDNRESVAAREYFDKLLDDATRRKPIWHNSALNYAYAIVRSAIARSIAARGLIASQGLFHRSELNQFNLADDLIEPFRAAVDQYVLGTVAQRHVGDNDAALTKDDRRLIVDIINQSVIINSKKFTIKYACDMVVESLVTAILSDDTTLLILPKII
ncbi:MAG: type II CRISPR-associated endonuclease Cas1 [Candidatus Nomurabacteria bacterium]|jgi:CRISPR-associated protein Cas1|nr:type II CRISPR-associated endonuclease Cas1 [Candidatus Nomurabacteria bacterium]